MVYSLFDKNNKRIVFHDLQDKGPWCQTGASYEEVFVKKYGEKLNIIINPEKKYNKYAPDLFNNSNHRLAELKTQNTPFFQAKKRFGIDQQYAVVFNKKDRDRYQEFYPEIDIFFWVDWVSVRFVSGDEKISVKPMSGIWYIPFSKLDKILDQAPLHFYYQRIDDNRGNARASYVISIKNPDFEKKS